MSTRAKCCPAANGPVTPPLWYSDKAAYSCQSPRFPCTWLTWQWLTDLAAFSREALRTVAAIAVPFLQTAPSVETGVRLARVLLHCKDRQSGRRWEAFKGVISVHYEKKKNSACSYTIKENELELWLFISHPFAGVWQRCSLSWPGLHVVLNTVGVCSHAELHLFLWR